MKRSGIRRCPVGPVERVCEFCGGTFVVPAAWVRRGGGRFCSRECLAGWRTTPEGRESQAARVRGKRLKDAEPVRDRPGALRRDAWRDPSKACRWPGCTRRGVKLDQHHVVYRQHVKRHGGDLWDGRNALALCAVHHATHHHQLTPLPLAALRADNLAFAFDLMGPAAFDYLRRRYSGGDDRLPALLSAADAGRYPAAWEVSA